MFDLQVMERGGSSDKTYLLTFQAVTDEDFDGWLAILGGQIDTSKPQLSSKSEMQSRNRTEGNKQEESLSLHVDELDESGIDFVKKCIQIIERRGLNEQGLYRVVGMQSKVNSIVVGHFGN